MNGNGAELPTRLGEPCWTENAPDRAITATARLTRELEPYFVATHEPFGELRDDRSEGTLDEHSLYNSLFHAGRANVFAVVHGDPGTGKSHLIRWLHLQCEADLQRGDLSNVVAVLIERRTGSMRDALQQIIDQLPPQYERHVRPISEAVGHLGDDLARHALVGKFKLELLKAAPNSGPSKNLHEFCGSPGTVTWLIRDGGTIDRIIHQLTEQSDVTDREALPAFTATDLIIPDIERTNIAPGMLELLEDFDFEQGNGETTYIDEAVSLFNSVARPAVKAMSGFIGGGLRDVIDDVRRELKTERKRLAIFVEDVSVMAALDDDLLNAVEPNPDPKLAPLIAIVGMTQTGYDNLLTRENLVGRTTDLIGLGTEVVEEWRQKPEALARFVARYLNVARLDDAGVAEVASSRRDGGDVACSACDRCPVKAVCHQTFGAVEFGQASVGLFPFTETSLATLLFNLREDPRRAIRRNPRGLLEHIVKPILRDERRPLSNGSFPLLRLPVDLGEPAGWTGFDARYLGGWPKDERSRLRRFVQGWIVARTADGVAKAVTPFIGPLRYPSLSADPGKAADGSSLGGMAAGAAQDGTKQRRTDAKPATTDLPENVSRPGRRVEESRELRAILKAIRDWADGATLSEDGEPRDLLFSLIRRGIDWDNECVPLTVYKDRAKDKSFVRFEDQRSRPVRQRVWFDVSRSEEARAVIEALARWKLQGIRSWNFPDGQIHFRVAGRWLRKNRAAIVNCLMPPVALRTDEPLKHAVRLLSVGTLLRRGVALSNDRAAIVKELLTEINADQVASVNGPDQAWVARVLDAYPKVAAFVISEVAVRQGGGGASFINPLPILKFARSPHSEPVVPKLSREFNAEKEHWQPRYGALAATDAVADLPGALLPRRQELSRRIAETTAALMDANVPTDDLRDGVAQYLGQLAGLLAVQEKHFPMGNDRIADLRPRLGRHKVEWAAALADIAAAVRTNSVVELLTAPVQPGLRAAEAIADSQNFIDTLEAEIAGHEAALCGGGDPLEIFEDIRVRLSTVAVATSPLPRVAGATTSGRG